MVPDDFRIALEISERGFPEDLAFVRVDNVLRLRSDQEISGAGLFQFCAVTVPKSIRRPKVVGIEARPFSDATGLFASIAQGQRDASLRLAGRDPDRHTKFSPPEIQF